MRAHKAQDSQGGLEFPFRGVTHSRPRKPVGGQTPRQQCTPESVLGHHNQKPLEEEMGKAAGPKIRKDACGESVLGGSKKGERKARGSQSSLQE